MSISNEIRQDNTASSSYDYRAKKNKFSCIGNNKYGCKDRRKS